MVIQVYASTSDHVDKEVKQFYEQLNSIIAQTPRKDILVVQGDWNAEAGSEEYQHWAGTVTRFTLWRDKRQRTEIPTVHKEPLTYPCQHPPPRQVV